MTERFLLNGVTCSERQEAISSATHAIQNGGGWIADVHFFSDVAVNFQCVISAGGVDRLVEELGELPFGFKGHDMAALALGAARLPAGEELKFSLQITFIHDEPDLRRHVPSVPG